MVSYHGRVLAYIAFILISFSTSHTYFVIKGYSSWNKTRRIQDVSPKPQVAADIDDIGDVSRVEESIHQIHEQRQHGNVAQHDLIVDRIATAVASGSRSFNKMYSIKRATKLGVKVFIGT